LTLLSLIHCDSHYDGVNPNPNPIISGDFQHLQKRGKNTVNVMN